MHRNWTSMVKSRQTLSESDRKTVADWAADCAERVLFLFETESPDDQRPRSAIARARAFACGDLTTAAAIRQRFGSGRVNGTSLSAAAVAAARAAGQSSAVSHMGAHGLGAAAFAIKAVCLSRPQDPHAAADEMRWQLTVMPPSVRAALRALPAVGTDPSGPLGPGMLSSGEIGRIIGTLQTELLAMARTAFRLPIADLPHSSKDQPHKKHDAARNCAIEKLLYAAHGHTQVTQIKHK